MSNNDKEILNSPKEAEMLSVGHGNWLSRVRVIAILEPGSLPMKRLRERAYETNTLLDATAGRKTRSVLVLDSNHVVLSALAPHTLTERLDVKKPKFSAAELEAHWGQFIS